MPPSGFLALVAVPLEPPARVPSDIIYAIDPVSGLLQLGAGAGNGPVVSPVAAASATFAFAPTQGGTIHCDANGVVHIADYGNNNVRLWNTGSSSAVLLGV